MQATNNPVDRAGLAAMIPAIDWDLFLPVSGLGEVQHFVAGSFQQVLQLGIVPQLTFWPLYTLVGALAGALVAMGAAAAARRLGATSRAGYAPAREPGA